MQTVYGEFRAEGSSRWVSAQVGKYHISGFDSAPSDLTAVALESMDVFGNWVQFAEHSEDVVKAFDFKVPGFVRFRCIEFTQGNPVVYSLTGE